VVWIQKNTRRFSGAVSHPVGKSCAVGRSQLTQGDGDRLWNAFDPIMKYLGIRYAWQREGETVRMTFELDHT
jgi:hypothetical protein